MDPFVRLPVLGALALAACAHQKPVVAAAPPPPPAVAPAPPPVATPSRPPPPAAARPPVRRRPALPGRQLPRHLPSLSACSLTRLHFDYDLAELHPAELPSLQRMARCIQANQPTHVLITGNADERGTVEYNLALGQRRAGAVARYLQDLGVPALRLSLVTYGKEAPLCTEHDEACWSRNRRAGVRPDQTAMDLHGKIRADEAREHALAAPAHPAGG